MSQMIAQVARIEPAARHERIVVGIDGSEESVTELRRAVRIASALDANVEAATSWRIPTPSGIRCNAVAPGAAATNIETPFKAAFAVERLGPFLQVKVPPVTTA